MFKNFVAVACGVIVFIFLSFIVGAFLHLVLFGWDSIILPQTISGRIMWFLFSAISGLIAGSLSKKQGFYVGIMTGFIVVIMPFAGVVFMNWGQPIFHTLFNDL